MKIKVILSYLESIAPLAYQEVYDNAGLITGQPDWNCRGALTCLDATEAVVDEAIEKDVNLIVAHHPILFKGVKSLNENSYVGRALIKAIKNDIALYAIHTNLDNITDGVNGKMADLLKLKNRKPLLPKPGTLLQLYTYVPVNAVEKVQNALYAAGAGKIGNYAECSFTVTGQGSFTPGEDANPAIGQRGKKEILNEVKIEVVFPAWCRQQVVKALLKSHPYEEVAYGVISLENAFSGTGSGIIGELPQPLPGEAVLKLLKEKFRLAVVRHTPLLPEPVSKLALCGGAGSFLIPRALAAGADLFVTADIKYHEFFDAEDRMVVADIGHYESEQFTVDLLADILREKFPNFAVLKTGVKTNPVHYYL